MRTSPSPRSILTVTVLLFACGGATPAAEEAAVADEAPAARETPSASGLESDAHARAVLALAPPRRARPLVAVLANDSGTETTDFLVPYGILARSDLADVVAVAPEAGPVTLLPALRIEAETSFAAFDRRHPEGADYVVVPALHDRDDPRVLDWIRRQSAAGAIVVGICSGAMVLSEAGLLADRAFTTHWFDIDRLSRANPGGRRVDDRRYVVDRGVVTTTGVSASVPVSLLLVEAIGGRARARALADALGVDDWSADHRSGAFELRSGQVALALGNWLAFWRHERVGVPVRPAVDEVGLAFVADAWSRTFRSEAVSVSVDGAPIRTRHGLLLLPDASETDAEVDWQVDPARLDSAARALDLVLRDMRCRYGREVAAFVALQLEAAAPGLTRPDAEGPRSDVACEGEAPPRARTSRQPKGSPRQISGALSWVRPDASRKIVPSETVIAQRSGPPAPSARAAMNASSIRAIPTSSGIDRDPS